MQSCRKCHAPAQFQILDSLTHRSFLIIFFLFPHENEFCEYSLKVANRSVFNPFMPSGLVYLFIITMFYRSLCTGYIMQAVQTLMPLFAASDLVLHYVYTICQCPFYRMLGKNRLTLVLLNKLRCHAYFNFLPIRLLNPNCCYKFTYLMTNSADPDQLASKPTDLDLHCLQRQSISGFSRTRVNKYP